MKALLLSALLSVSLLVPVRGQNPPVITSFSQNGSLVCTNLQPGSTAIVEWASSPDGPWSSTWTGLDAVTVNGAGAISVSVPMFYRVRGTAVGSAQIEVSATTLVVAEGGVGTFNVRLTAQPPAETTVGVSVADTSKATGSPTTLTFSTANWNTFQTVTVSGVSDANTQNESTVLNLTSAGLTSRAITVNVTDDDVQGISSSVISLTVSEAATGSFGVRLTAQPAANVSVFIASGNTAKATAAPNLLTFTPVNWNDFQNITVSGVNDPDQINESVTITLSSSGASNRTVSVTVADDD